MMPSDRTCGSKGRVVERDNQAVDGEGTLVVGNQVGPLFNGLVHVVDGRVADAFVFHHVEAHFSKPIQAFSPRVYRLICVHQRERNPLYFATFHLFNILQRERSRCEVAWVGVCFICFHVEYFKVCVRNHSLSANHKMSCGLDGGRNSLNGRSQMGDVGADVSVATRYHLGEFPIVISHHEGQTVQLPRQPYRSSFSPFYQFFGLLGLRQ